MKTLIYSLIRSTNQGFASSQPKHADAFARFDRLLVGCHSVEFLQCAPAEPDLLFPISPAGMRRLHRPLQTDRILHIEGALGLQFLRTDENTAENPHGKRPGNDPAPPGLPNRTGQIWTMPDPAKPNIMKEGRQSLQGNEFETHIVYWCELHPSHGYLANLPSLRHAYQNHVDRPC